LPVATNRQNSTNVSPFSRFSPNRISSRVDGSASPVRGDGNQPLTPLKVKNHIVARAIHEQPEHGLLIFAYLAFPSDKARPMRRENQWKLAGTF